MKKLLLLAFILPVFAYAQENMDTTVKKWEGMNIKECQEFFLSELIKKDGDVYPILGKGRITPQTKTIYIANQPYLKDAPQKVEGVNIQYIDIDSNLKWLCKEVKKNDAAVFYLSNFQMDAKMSEMYLFPITVKSGLFGSKMEYEEESAKINFFYDYDPPRFHYRGVEAISLD